MLLYFLRYSVTNSKKRVGKMVQKVLQKIEQYFLTFWVYVPRLNRVKLLSFGQNLSPLDLQANVYISRIFPFSQCHALFLGYKIIFLSPFFRLGTHKVYYYLSYKAENLINVAPHIRDTAISFSTLRLYIFQDNFNGMWTLQSQPFLPLENCI